MPGYREYSEQEALNRLVQDGSAGKIAGERVADDYLATRRVASPLDTALVSASKLLKTGPGYLSGFFVVAASATPLLRFYDSLTATGSLLVPQFTPTANTMYNLGADVAAAVGIYCEISGTVSLLPYGG